MAKEGNPNPTGGKPDKLIRDALKAALRQDANQLKRIAENWVKRAEDDQMAANALADRIDGKAVQAIVGDNDYDPISLRNIVNELDGRSAGLPKIEG
jgi:hypothetical protein